MPYLEHSLPITYVLSSRQMTPANLIKKQSQRWHIWKKFVQPHLLFQIKTTRTNTIWKTIVSNIYIYENNVSLDINLK